MGDNLPQQPFPPSEPLPVTPPPPSAPPPEPPPVQVPPTEPPPTLQDELVPQDSCRDKSPPLPRAMRPASAPPRRRVHVVEGGPSTTELSAMSEHQRCKYYRRSNPNAQWKHMAATRYTVDDGSTSPRVRQSNELHREQRFGHDEATEKLEPGTGRFAHGTDDERKRRSAEERSEPSSPSKQSDGVCDASGTHAAKRGPCSDTVKESVRIANGVGGIGDAVADGHTSKSRVSGELILRGPRSSQDPMYEVVFDTREVLTSPWSSTCLEDVFMMDDGDAEPQERVTES